MNEREKQEWLDGAVDTNGNEARQIGEIISDMWCKNGRSDFQAAPKVVLPVSVKESGQGINHAAFRARLFAASSARLSSDAQPLAANVDHWSLGMLSRRIQDRTVCGDTEQMAATVSGSPACFTICA